MNTKIKNITTSAIFIALLITVQLVTKSLGQIFTGSAVNFVLAMSAILLNLPSYIAVGFVSPFLAFILGVGPSLIAIVPCISIGNIVYVVSINFLYKKLSKDKLILKELSIVIGSLIKFVILYLLVVSMVIPSLNLPTAQANMMSNMFSIPQLITALIGGTLANIVSEYIKK